jgi:SHS2 domain-containing protein
MPERGHRARPHTADVIIEARGPTRSECLEEAVLGLVSAFADVGDQAPEGRWPVKLEAGDDEETLVALLDEVIFVVDTLGVVPATVVLEEASDGGISGWLGTVPAASVEVTGAPPKGVSRSELHFGVERGGWRCHAQIDV